ncbi:RNA methyltransferase [Paraflavitalea sp. CAU 1676]|uniref:methyltransferase RsmF C-terminal domain-like protein n=1 Tax=Paraflavitalea sp. CAU 1676 TaxID=3032598 RepID=UPI0023DA99D7|nr:RNA methyltransferase [Paraflavitalea sp. CAU 1676]MDF2192486.1 RNA methyltransferase [Paraflavitalea sp. CAU 1676]
MNLPPALLESLEGVKGYNRTSFEAVHQSGKQVTSIRLNPLRVAAVDAEAGATDNEELPAALRLLLKDTAITASSIPWTTSGYYLSERPSFTFDPALHGGAYYVQEASSMFLEQALKQTTDLRKDIRVLDLCAAPGGKSSLLQSLITPGSLLISNDVIKSRAAILEENLTKWGAANTIVTNNDPAHFARLENFFDVLVIDAPCSGSGLFRRDEEAIKEWSEHNVALCSQRQRRILADSFGCLKEGGTLIYSTCSYSKEEDEDILDWLMQEFELESLPLQTDPAWGIVETTSSVSQATGYRFFPDQVKGEGLFLACFRKKEGSGNTARLPKKTKWQKVSKTEAAIIQPWLNPQQSIQLWKQGDMIIALPASLEEALHIAAEHLYLRKAGIIIGKVAGNSLVPDHALALSELLATTTVAVSLKKENALQYLRREEVTIQAAQTGWTLVKYQGIALGWIKVLANRINNYYPSAWRILKSGNN